VKFSEEFFSMTRKISSVCFGGVDFIIAVNEHKPIVPNKIANCLEYKSGSQSRRSCL
jgi:hypothetical protein